MSTNNNQAYFDLLYTYATCMREPLEEFNDRVYQNPLYSENNLQAYCTEERNNLKAYIQENLNNQKN